MSSHRFHEKRYLRNNDQVRSNLGQIWYWQEWNSLLDRGPWIGIYWWASKNYVVCLQNFFILPSFAPAGTCCHHCVSVRGQSLTEANLASKRTCTRSGSTIFQAIPHTELLRFYCKTHFSLPNVSLRYYLRLTHTQRVHLKYKPDNISPTQTRPTHPACHPGPIYSLNAYFELNPAKIWILNDTLNCPRYVVVDISKLFPKLRMNFD